MAAVFLIEKHECSSANDTFATLHVPIVGLVKVQNVIRVS